MNPARSALTYKGLYMDAASGVHILETVKQAKALAAELDQPILFRFNGVIVEVKRDSDVAVIVAQYNTEFRA